eukprot:758335_1
MDVVSAVDHVSLRDSLPWSWTFLEITKLLSRYPSGLSEAIVGTELQNEWSQCRGTGWRDRGESGLGKGALALSAILQQRRVQDTDRLESTLTTVYFKPQTTTCMFTLSQSHSDKSSSVEGRKPAHLHCYLHKRFDRVMGIDGSVEGESNPSLLSSGRTVRLTGCKLFHSKKGLILLPTELVIPVLSEKSDKKYMELAYDSGTVEDVINRQRVPEKLVVTVGRIGSSRHVNPASTHHHTRRRITLYPYSRASQTLSAPFTQISQIRGISVDLVLWDEQCGLGELFKKGDVLVLDRPQGNSNAGKIFLEYGPDTVLSVLPASSCSSHKQTSLLRSPMPSYTQITQRSPSQNSLSRAELDYEFFPDRVTITQLRPGIANLMLCARVDRLWKEVSTDSQRGPAHALRLSDHSGSVDALFFGSAADAISKVLPGHVLLIRGLSTVQRELKTSPKKTQVYPDLSTSALDLTCGFFRDHIDARVVNLSLLKGVLTSPCVARQISLSRITPGVSFTCRACITDIAESTEDHTIGTESYLVEIDDGTARMHSYIGLDILESILGTFSSANMDRIRGLEFTMLLSPFYVDSKQHYRIDQLLKSDRSLSVLCG